MIRNKRVRSERDRMGGGSGVRVSGCERIRSERIGGVMIRSDRVRRGEDQE